MSSSRFCSYSPIVGYASLALRDSGLFKLQSYFQKIPFETDIAAEDLHPRQDYRPLWSEVLELIERQAITTLVVPSLFHIAGDDFNLLRDVLKLMRIQGVRLKSLSEWVDNSRQPDNEILAGFIKKGLPGIGAAIDRNGVSYE